MSKPKTITIDEEKYIRLSDAGLVESVDNEKEPLMIIMSDDRGLCIVGNVDLSGDDWLVKIKNGRCVIRWGTEEHLAELAAKGPMDNTRLGYTHPHIIPRRHIGLVLPCNAGNWAKK
jgi:hypothetical protein